MPNHLRNFFSHLICRDHESGQNEAQKRETPNTNCLRKKLLNKREVKSTSGAWQNLGDSKTKSIEIEKFENNKIHRKLKKSCSPKTKKTLTHTQEISDANEKLTMRNYYLKEYAYHHKPKSSINPILNVLSCNASYNNDSRHDSQKKAENSLDIKPQYMSLLVNKNSNKLSPEKVRLTDAIHDNHGNKTPAPK